MVKKRAETEAEKKARENFRRMRTKIRRDAASQEASRAEWKPSEERVEGELLSNKLHLSVERDKANATRKSIKTFKNLSKDPDFKNRRETIEGMAETSENKLSEINKSRLARLVDRERILRAKRKLKSKKSRKKRK